MDSDFTNANFKPRNFENRNKIFLNNLPPSANEENVRDVCENFGTTISVLVVPQKNKNGFMSQVEFANTESATRALLNLHNLTVGNSTISASFYKEKNSEPLSEHVIKVTNIPECYFEEDLCTIFSTYGNVKHIKIVVKFLEKIGYITYDDTFSAEQAMIELQNYRANSTIKEGLKLSYAKRRKNDDAKQTPTKQILVQNIPQDWNQLLLNNLFKQYGEIESIRININTKSRKKVALVKFENENSASAAKKNLHNVIVDNKNNKLFIRFFNESRPNFKIGVKGKVPCKFFQNGHCVRGMDCWFSHENSNDRFQLSNQGQ